MAGTHPERAGERLVDMAELVDRLKRSRRSIEKDIEAGRVPQPLRIGRSVRWRLADIETWIASGCPAADATALAGKDPLARIGQTSTTSLGHTSGRSACDRPGREGAEGGR